MKRGNHRENDIGLKLIRSAGKTDNDIYSLSEFREVINEAYGTQKFMSKNIFKHWRPPCSQYHRATYRHGKSQQIDKDLNLTLLMLEWRILKKNSNWFRQTISDEITIFLSSCSFVFEACSKLCSKILHKVLEIKLTSIRWGPMSNRWGHVLPMVVLGGI